MSQSDMLYSETFKAHIVNFCRLRDDISIKDASQYIEVFRQSNILNVILNDPGNNDAITCVKIFLERNPMLPQIFLSRFISVCRCTIRITPSSFGSSQIDSCIATAIVDNLRPNETVTYFTTEAMTETLNKEIQNQTVMYRCENRVPSLYRIKFNDALVRELVNAEIDYYSTITWGNNQNGRTVDSFVKRSSRVQ